VVKNIFKLNEMKNIIILVVTVVFASLQTDGQTLKEAKKLLNKRYSLLDSLSYQRIITEGNWTLSHMMEPNFPFRRYSDLGRNIALYFESDSCFFQNLTTGKVTPFGNYRFYEDYYLLLIPDENEITYYSIVYLEEDKYLVVEMHVIDNEKSNHLKNTKKRLLYVNRLLE